MTRLYFYDVPHEAEIRYYNDARFHYLVCSIVKETGISVSIVIHVVLALEKMKFLREDL